MMSRLRKLRKLDLKQMISEMQLGADVESMRRKELVDLIREIPHWDRHVRCYNARDPCTLEPLHSISKEYYLEWNQTGKTFGSDNRSVRRLFEYEHYELPFALDFEEEERTDMRESSDLVRFIRETSPVATLDTPIVNVSTCFLFEIERLCGGNFGYINGNISNKILSNPDVFEIHFVLLNAMFNVCQQLQMECVHITTVFIETCYQPLLTSSFSNKSEFLHFVLYVLTRFIDQVGDRGHNVIFALFNDI